MTKETKLSAFSFEGFLISETHITRKEGKQGKFKIDLTPSGKYIKKLKQFRLNLEVRVYDEKSFEAIIKTQSLFEFKEDVNESEIGTYFYVNSSAIIFPYIRAYISALTALSGLKTITIPTMNLTGLGEKLKRKTTFD